MTALIRTRLALIVCVFMPLFIASAHARTVVERSTRSTFRLLIIPVYFSPDPDCDPNCPVGDYDCDNFQPIQWIPDPADIWNAYFCSCDQEPCDHCASSPCDTPPCNPAYPPAGDLSINDYYLENSFGHLSLMGDVTTNYELTVDVCPSQSEVLGDIAAAAVQAAQSDTLTGPLPGVGWDIHLDATGRMVSNSYDGLVILHPRVPHHNYFGFTNRTKRIVWQDGFGWRVGAHELGHLMADSVGHSGAWECPDSIWDGACIHSAQNDYFDVMGYGYGHFKVPLKLKYGWLDENQVLTLSAGDNGVYTLTPLETPDGLKALRVPRDDEYYHFEFRQPIGEVEADLLDILTQNFPGLDQWSLNGVIAYRTRGGASGATLLLDMTPNSVVGFGQSSVIADHIDGMLHVGQYHHDPQVGFIRVLEIRGAGTERAEIDVEVLFDSDCNANGVSDVCDVDCQAIQGLCDQAACGSSNDCNVNQVPDECDVDCDANGIPDDCDGDNGELQDCDQNGLLDACEESFADCNQNTVMDSCDIAAFISLDQLPAGGNGIPDECETDCNNNQIPDAGEPGGDSDCNEDGVLDWCQCADGELADCNTNTIPDICEPGGDRDCDGNGATDWCDVVASPELDCDENGQLDTCQASTVWEETTLTTQQENMDQQLGSALAISGDWMVAGAPTDSSTTYHGGSAYVYHAVDGQWEFHSRLEAVDAYSSDYFGQSIAIDADTIVVGAYRDDDHGTESGSAYVFMLEDDEWTMHTKLTAQDGEDGDWFGWSVDVAEETITVGAHGEDSGGTRAGAVYLFTLENGLWSQKAKLLADDGVAGASFGSDVSLSGHRLAIGAERDRSRGSVYVFEEVGNQWVQQAKITAEAPILDDMFGTSVSLDDDTLAVGTYNIHSPLPGKAYVFKHENAQWLQEVILTANSTQPRNQFGRSVAIEDTTVLVGAPLIATLYVFDDTGATWSRTSEFSTDDQIYSGLGSEVVIDDGRLLAGQPGGTWIQPEVGFARIYQRLSADCDGNDVLDSCELAVAPELDSDANGVLDTCLSPEDCNENAIPDVCDIDCSAPYCRYADAHECGSGADVNQNGMLDECEPYPDCNKNGVLDTHEVDTGAAMDINANGILDECELNRAFYVDDDAPGDPGPGEPMVSDPHADGTVEHPYDSIRAAVSASLSGDTIIVRDGVYTGDWDIDLVNRSLLIQSENGPEHTIIDGDNTERDFIFRVDSSTDGTRIEGLTVRRFTGLSQGAIISDHSRLTLSECALTELGVDGAGVIVATQGELTLNDCTITNIEGSGVFAESSRLSLERCRILGGSKSGLYVTDSQATLRGCFLAHNSRHALAGTGSDALLFDCTITRNIYSNSWYQTAYGAGIHWINGRLELHGSQLSHNSGTFASQGGGLYISGCNHVLLSDTEVSHNVASYAGGGISASQSNLEIKHSHFTNNTAGRGGAVQLSESSIILVNSMLESNTADHGAGIYGSDCDITVINVLIAGNRAGVCSAFHLGGGKATLTNTSIISNHSDTFGGTLCCTEGSVHISNSLLWENTNPQDVSLLLLDHPQVSISHSNIQHGPACIQDWTADANVLWDLKTVFDANPELEDPQVGDYRLRQGSPCIDVGSNPHVPSFANEDLAGALRVIDGNGLWETTSFDTVDIGAYEYQPNLCNYADINQDGQVDASDAELLHQCIEGDTELPIECRSADINHDGQLDEQDAATFADWSTECSNDLAENVPSTERRSSRAALPIDTSAPRDESH